jgi:Acyl carrier protein phosphodiesterase
MVSCLEPGYNRCQVPGISKYPIKKFIENDLTHDLTPFLNDSTIRKFYGNQPAAEGSLPDKISYAEKIFREKEADILVIGTPMHNVSISAPLGQTS